MAFGHLGDGNIHFNVSQPINADTNDFLGKWNEINEIVFDIAQNLKGSFSAEHGIGKLKREELKKYNSSIEVNLMHSIK